MLSRAILLLALVMASSVLLVGCGSSTANVDSKDYYTGPLKARGGRGGPSTTTKSAEPATK